MLKGTVEDSPMTTIIPIPAFGDNYIQVMRNMHGCGGEYALANLRFACVVEAADVLLQERPGTRTGKRDRGESTQPPTIREKRATAPFPRSDEPSLRAAAKRRASSALADRIAVFDEIRSRNNAF
jgi:hydroxyacylglutathione hydrolase